MSKSQRTKGAAYEREICKKLSEHESSVVCGKTTPFDPTESGWIRGSTSRHNLKMTLTTKTTMDGKTNPERTASRSTTTTRKTVNLDPTE